MSLCKQQLIFFLLSTTVQRTYLLLVLYFAPAECFFTFCRFLSFLNFSHCVSLCFTLFYYLSLFFIFCEHFLRSIIVFHFQTVFFSTVRSFFLSIFLTIMHFYNYSSHFCTRSQCVAVSFTISPDKIRFTSSHFFLCVTFFFSLHWIIFESSSQLFIFFKIFYYLLLYITHVQSTSFVALSITM